MTENERLKYLRKNGLGMTLEELGPYVGLSKSGVSEIESGRRPVSDKHIRMLTAEPINGKRVNEHWLRTGEGSMFLEMTSKNEVSDWIESIFANEPNGRKARLVAALSKLTPEGWNALYGLAASVVGEVPAGSAPDKEEGVDDEKIEREADMLRESFIRIRRGGATQSELFNSAETPA